MQSYSARIFHHFSAATCNIASILSVLKFSMLDILQICLRIENSLGSKTRANLAGFASKNDEISGLARFFWCLFLFLILITKSVFAKAPCVFKGLPAEGLPIRAGYTDFIPAEKLAPFKEALPQVVDLKIQRTLNSPDTMWYDEDSMVYAYQDSIEVVVGTRANCVGRKVGLDNGGSASIAKLLNLFGEDYRFRFPFRTVAGTDDVTNIYTINFWSPPKINGVVAPVKYWKNSHRGHWYWVFPVGTIFGEVLYQQGPLGKWVVFEIRTRERYLNGWAVNVFRPFGTAKELSQAIQLARPNWAADRDLKNMIQYLHNPHTLIPASMESKPYGKVFPTIRGSLDPLPDLMESTLITELLTRTPFVSVEGKIWKENGQLETYAPGSQANFSIVPKGYKMGLIAVNEVSCQRCHSETSRRIETFELEAMLYGEVWGEDQIFTWHLFKPDQFIFGVWDDTQGSRVANPRLQQAGLIKNEKLFGGDSVYRRLPNAFDARSFPKSASKQ